MPSLTQPLSPARAWPLRAAGYLLLALAMTWPLTLRLGVAAPGLPTVDATDTMMLRGLVADLLTHPWDAPHTDGIYFPAGYPLLHLTPNLLDHLTGAPFVWLLPFPLNDNLWWLTILVLSGLFAHRLGLRIGGTEAAGLLAGVAWMLSEPLARELNLSHAPQALMFWAPLTLHAALDLRDRHALRDAALTGLFLALAALGYWYYGLFLGLALIPLLIGLPLRRLAVLVGVVATLCAPFAWPHLAGWGQMPLSMGVQAPPPSNLPPSYLALDASEAFVARHGTDPLFWLRRTPIDLSDRVSILLLLAALWGGRRWDARTRWALWAGVSLGAVMVLGTHLRWGDELWLLHGQPVRLPFYWLRRLHPVLGRLDWPERWGLLIPLGLIALAARAPRPAWWALGVLVESFVFSGNLPTQITDLRHQRCWAELSSASGAVLELPLKRSGLLASRVSVHQRFHHRPLVNPVMLPPGGEPPQAWSDWISTQPMLVYLRRFEDGRWPSDPGADALRDLRAAGVSAIALDAEPGGLLSPGAIQRYRAGLSRHLGAPIDLGCALVWWLDADAPTGMDKQAADAWRTAATQWKTAHREDTLQTLIRPTWNQLQAPLGP